MVVVKQGVLPPPGKHYRVYLNADHKKNKWYLRVTHSYPNNNQHFRAGTYDSKDEALLGLERLDPIHPKKGRSKPGTVDRYNNGMWRVRVKYKREHMHVGYYKKEVDAQAKLAEALADPSYLEERYMSLLAKRRRKVSLQKRKRNKVDGVRREDAMMMINKQMRTQYSFANNFGKMPFNNYGNAYRAAFGQPPQNGQAFTTHAPLYPQYVTPEPHGLPCVPPMVEDDTKISWCDDPILEPKIEPVLGRMCLPSQVQPQFTVKMEPKLLKDQTAPHPFLRTIQGHTNAPLMPYYCPALNNYMFGVPV